jgi:hypothetical protein
MMLKKPKKKGGGAKKEKKMVVHEREDAEEDVDNLDNNNTDGRDNVGVIFLSSSLRYHADKIAFPWYLKEIETNGICART